MILQMCGRAGRPPFDVTGTVIIMTRKETVHLYENLLSGCEIVESQLLSNLIEHLNAEIVQLTVSDVSVAIQWLKCSYLYVRIKKNPENYGMKQNILCEYLENQMRDICIQNINELSRHGMISKDADGFLLNPLVPGKLMAKYYLKFDTMKGVVHASENSCVEELLHIVCRSEEIAWIQLRRNEKKILNDINFDKEGRLLYHVMGENGKKKRRIQTKEEKIFILINDCLTGDPLIHDLSLIQDVQSICSNGCRIAKCMKECFIYRKSYKGALNSTLLAKCLYQRLWDSSPYLLKQLSGIGMVTAKALQTAGINSFETMAEADPRKIEIVTGRKYPFGNHIKESLSSLPPKIKIDIQEVDCKMKGKTKMCILLTREQDMSLLIKRHYGDMVVASEEENLILFHEKLRAEEFSSPYKVTIMVSCPQLGKLTVKADFIFEEYVGLDVHEKHVITRNVNSITREYHRNKVQSPVHSLANEVYVIEDDTSSDSNVQTEGQHVMVPSKRAISSTIAPSIDRPSFDLLQDEEEDMVFDAPEECKILTEKTIFNHIRKKSKNLPVLVPSKAMDLSYEPLILRTICTSSRVDASSSRQKMNLMDSLPTTQTSPGFHSKEECSAKSIVPVNPPNQERKDKCYSSENSNNISQLKCNNWQYTYDNSDITEDEKIALNVFPMEEKHEVMSGKAKSASSLTVERKSRLYCSESASNDMQLESTLNLLTSKVDDGCHFAKGRGGLFEKTEKHEVTFMGFKSVFSFL